MELFLCSDFMNKRFIGWVVFFFLLLSCVPIFVEMKWFMAAKSMGIITVVSLSIALWVWRIQSARQAVGNKRVSINLNDQYWLNKHCSFYKKLPAKDKSVFEDRIGLFLADVTMYTENEHQLAKDECFSVAMSYVISSWVDNFSRSYGISKVCFSDNNDGQCEIKKIADEYILCIDISLARAQTSYDDYNSSPLGQVWSSI